MNKKTIVSATLVIGLAGAIGTWELGRQGGVSAVTGLATGGGITPNVLIIVADDLGVDKVGAYLVDVDPGYGQSATAMPQTPVIDQLASSGVRFTDAWANPACSPTRASLLTGNFAFRHGVGRAIGQEGSQELGLDETTIAHVAKDAGFKTGLFGKWHLGEGELPEVWSEEESWEDHIGQMIAVEFPPTLLGFDAFRGTRSDLDVGSFTGYYDWLSLTSIHNAATNFTVPNAQTEYASFATTNSAVNWINNQSGNWIASVNYHAPHSPYDLPPEDCGYSQQSSATNRLVYRSMVECLDQQVGELLDGINRLSNTVIIFLGDNGTSSSVAEDIFDDGRGKGTLYESGIRVPFIVADGLDYKISQGQAGAAMVAMGMGRVKNPGREVADLVHAVDIFATVNDLVEGSSPNSQDSVSLWPYLQETAGPTRQFVYSELFKDTNGTAAYREGNLKLVVRARDQGNGFCRSRYELFNVLVDRFEQSDMATNNPSALQDLTDKFNALVATEPGHWLDVPDC